MLRKLLLVVAIGMLVLVLIDCKKENTPEPSLKDKQLAALTATWTCTQAIKDDINQTGYDGFKITVAGTPGNSTFGYTCIGRPASSPWPSSGTFTFAETNPQNSLMRQDGASINYSIDGNTLALTFDYNGEGFAGRISEIPGAWVFHFTKN